MQNSQAVKSGVAFKTLLEKLQNKRWHPRNDRNVNA